MRLNTVQLAVSLVCSLSLAGCGALAEKPSRIITYAVDDSITGRLIQDVCLKQGNILIDSLQPDDRFVLTPITASTFTDFTGRHDWTLPPFDLLDTELLQQAHMDDLKNEIRADLKHMVQRQDAKNSEILDVFNVEAQVVSPDRTRIPVLVICSDMRQDTSRWNFDTHQVDSGYIHQLIEDRRRSGALPTLAGVKVYIVGAKPTSLAKFYEIRSGVLAYCKAIQADCSPQRYTLSGLVSVRS